MSKNKTNYYDQVIKFKVTDTESEAIKNLAEKTNMSVSEYCRRCTLYEDKLTVVDRAADILYYLAMMSNQINDLLQYYNNFISDPYKYLEEPMQFLQEEMNTLWQFLK